MAIIHDAFRPSVADAKVVSSGVAQWFAVTSAQRRSRERGRGRRERTMQSRDAQNEQALCKGCVWLSFLLVSFLLLCGGGGVRAEAKSSRAETQKNASGALQNALPAVSYLDT
jgi:hypothetical protein